MVKSVVLHCTNKRKSALFSGTFLWCGWRDLNLLIRKKALIYGHFSMLLQRSCFVPSSISVFLITPRRHWFMRSSYTKCGQKCGQKSAPPRGPALTRDGKSDRQRELPFLRARLSAIKAVLFLCASISDTKAVYHHLPDICFGNTTGEFTGAKVSKTEKESGSSHKDHSLKDAFPANLQAIASYHRTEGQRKSPFQFYAQNPKNYRHFKGWNTSHSIVSLTRYPRPGEAQATACESGPESKCRTGIFSPAVRIISVGFLLFTLIAPYEQIKPGELSLPSRSMSLSPAIIRHCQRIRQGSGNRDMCR